MRFQEMPSANRSLGERAAVAISD
jgi:hypothetical protein